MAVLICSESKPKHLKRSKNRRCHFFRFISFFSLLKFQISGSANSLHDFDSDVEKKRFPIDTEIST